MVEEKCDASMAAQSIDAPDNYRLECSVPLEALLMGNAAFGE
jgi:hypothetical protein